MLEARYASLAAAARFKGSTMTQDAVALDLVLSICFTAVTRVGRAGGHAHGMVAAVAVMAAVVVAAAEVAESAAWCLHPGVLLLSERSLVASALPFPPRRSCGA